MSDLRRALERLVDESRAVQRYVNHEGTDNEADSFNEAIKEAEAALAGAPRQPGAWMKWDGDYEKQAYDVWVAGCDVVLGCWPGDGAMYATDGTGRRWRPQETLAIRVSAYQGHYPAPFKKVIMKITEHGVTGVSQETLEEPYDTALSKATAGHSKVGRRASRESGK